jgi:hypothetical protein
MKRLIVAFIWLIGLAMVPEAQPLNPSCATCPAQGNITPAKTAE